MSTRSGIIRSRGVAVRVSKILGLAAAALFVLAPVAGGASPTPGWTSPYQGPWTNDTDQCPPSTLPPPVIGCTASAAGTDASTGALVAHNDLSSREPGHSYPVFTSGGGPVTSFVLTAPARRITFTFTYNVRTARATASNPGPNAGDSSWSYVALTVGAHAGPPSCRGCLGGVDYYPHVASTTPGDAIKWRSALALTLTLDVGATLPAGTQIDITAGLIAATQVTGSIDVDGAHATADLDATLVGIRADITR
jgi:hypothetical protein